MAFIPPADLTEPVESKSSSAFTGIPPATLKFNELVPLSPLNRAKKIWSSFSSSNASGFLKGAIASKIIDYAFDALITPSPSSYTWKRTIHSLIHMYETDSVIQGLIKIEHDTNANHHSPKTAFYVELSSQLKPYFDGSIDFVHWDNNRFDAPIDDIVVTLSKLDQHVAERYHVNIVYSEHIEYDSSDHYLYIVDLDGVRYGLYSAMKKSKSEVFRHAPDNIMFSKDDAHSMIGEFLNTISTIVKANFVATIDPQKNIIEMEQYSTKVVKRKRSVDKMPNVDLDEIKQSIASALEKKKRRVIALVGDAGLGKTIAMHSIINAFLDIPAFIVTPAAIGGYSSAVAIKSIFDSVKSLDSILVFDDFEGFGVSEKDDVTTEFLRQLDGSSGFSGIAILVVNDPKELHHTIINRPGRVDEVYEIGYLKSVKDIVSVLSNYFNDAKFNFDAAYDKSFNWMIKNKFSTARAIHAVEYCMDHGSVTPESLLFAAKRMSDFERTALKSCVKGRLVEHDFDEPEAEVKNKKQRKLKQLAIVSSND